MQLQLICVFVLANAKVCFSRNAAHLSISSEKRINLFLNDFCPLKQVPFAHCVLSECIFPLISAILVVHSCYLLFILIDFYLMFCVIFVYYVKCFITSSSNHERKQTQTILHAQK